MDKDKRIASVGKHTHWTEQVFYSVDHCATNRDPSGQLLRPESSRLQVSLIERGGGTLSKLGNTETLTLSLTGAIMTPPIFNRRSIARN